MFHLGCARERDKSYFLISDVSANNITLCCRQHAAHKVRVKQAYFKLLSLSIKLPQIHLQDRNKQLAKSTVSTQIRITDRKLSWATNVQNAMGKGQKCSKFLKGIYRRYLQHCIQNLHDQPWSMTTKNGYSKAKLSAESVQDPEHYIGYHH